jgi:hypothetical protein
MSLGEDVTQETCRTIEGVAMKNLMLTLGLLTIAASFSPAQWSGDSHGGVSIGVFYSSLGAYGEWIPIDGGMYAWRPAGVMAGWRPYSRGHWIWTDDGWYWASNEPWAWAAYHYGRWYYDDYYGWIWLPGYDWSPAWVEWRYGEDCVGWAPLSPYAVFDLHVGIHYINRWETPYHYWSFVPYRHFVDPDMHRYVYRTENNTRYIGNTRSGGDVRYDGGRIVTRGPGRDVVERRGEVSVMRADISDARDQRQERIVRTGDRQRIEVYRPRIEEHLADGNAIRPDRVGASDRKVALDAGAIDARSTGKLGRTGEQKADDVRRSSSAVQHNDERTSKRDQEQLPTPQPGRVEQQQRRLDQRSESPAPQREQRRVGSREYRQERQIDRPVLPKVEPRVARPERRVDRQADVPQGRPQVQREQLPARRDNVDRSVIRSREPERVMRRDPQPSVSQRGEGRARTERKDQ